MFTPPLNLPAPGRCQALCVILSILQSHVFLVNSRLDHFSAPCIAARVPFFRSYGVNLPNSLAMIHSSTSGFSPFPPVSVYGTGSDRLDRRSFSWESDYRRYQIARRLSVLSAFSRDHLLNCPSTYNIKPAIPSAGGRVTPPSLR